MADLSGGAVAPADAPSAPVGGAPIDENGATYTQPLGSQIPSDPQDKAEPEPKPVSLDDSIDRAIAKSAEKAKAAEAKPAEAKAPEPVKEAPKKAEPQRAEDGKFAPKADKAQEAPKVEAKAPAAKPSFTAGEPPARFSADAKERWAETPDPVRAETERAIRELTEGHQKYKANAEAYESYRELDDIAKQSGKRGADVFRQYYEMEQHLQRDLVGGLDTICQKLGVSLRDVAAHVLNQTPDQNASQQDATIRELRATIQRLEQQVGGVTQTIQQQQTAAVSKEVQEFAAAHPRFDELSDDIAFFLKTRTKDLKEAYELAERLNPAPAKASEQPQASSAAVIDLPAHTEKGQKSITGAPSAGSTPAKGKRVALSIDESLEKAFGRAG